jgi:hypothetical protein
MSDFAKNVRNGSFPNEWLRARVMMLQGVANCCFKVGNGSEVAAAGSLGRNQAKEALDRIQSRG